MSIASVRVGIAVASFAAALSASAVPVVAPSSVKATQHEFKRTVTIEYQLSGEPGIVTVDIQTNVSGSVWASIGGEHYQTMYGAVNRINTNVTAKSYAYWQPDVDWESNDPVAANVRAVVTARSTNSPPDYMVVDLVTKSNLFFYANAESLPGGVGDVKYKTDWLVMRKVPAKGVTWRMGSPTTEPNRYAGWQANYEPARLVVLTNDYYLGIYELTQKQYWNVCDGKNEPSPSNYGGFNPDILPVDSASLGYVRGSCGPGAAQCWPERGHDVAYSSTTPTYYKLGYLRRKTGLMFDLPTSAQWEYACRAGTGDGYNGGTVDEYAWYSCNATNEETNALATHPVGTKKANAWGFYDMHGNVSEVVLERSFYPTAEAGVTYVEPTIPLGVTTSPAYYIVRGGSVADTAVECRSAANNRIQTVGKNNGYRLWAPVEIPYK